jgi:hypothetical protein
MLNTEHFEMMMMMTADNKCAWKKPVSWTGVGLNLGLYNKKPMTDCLSHSTAKYLLHITLDQ